MLACAAGDASRDVAVPVHFIAPYKSPARHGSEAAVARLAGLTAWRQSSARVAAGERVLVPGAWARAKVTFVVEFAQALGCRSSARSEEKLSRARRDSARRMACSDTGRPTGRARVGVVDVVIDSIGEPMALLGEFSAPAGTAGQLRAALWLRSVAGNREGLPCTGHAWHKPTSRAVCCHDRALGASDVPLFSEYSLEAISSPRTAEFSRGALEGSAIAIPS